MANLPSQQLSEGCRQDLLRDCPATLGVNDGHPCYVATVRKFAHAGAHAGLNLERLIKILESGVPITSVLDLIQSRLNPPAEAEMPHEQPFSTGSIPSSACPASR